MIEFGSERNACSVLYCSGAKAGREAIQNGAGSCDDLDCTKVPSRKNISALAVLCYRKFRYDSRCWVQAPGGNRRVWYCFVLFFRSVWMCTRERVQTRARPG